MLIKCKDCGIQYSILRSESVKCSCNRIDLINPNQKNIIDGNLIANLSYQERYISLYWIFFDSHLKSTYEKASEIWKMLNDQERNITAASIEALNRVKQEQLKNTKINWEQSITTVMNKGAPHVSLSWQGYNPHNPYPELYINDDQK